MTRPSEVDRNTLELILGGARWADTAAGTVSLSVQQTLDAVTTARRILHRRSSGVLAELTNHDIVWLLVNGWDPAGADDDWQSWMDSEPVGRIGPWVWRLLAVGLALIFAVTALGLALS